MIKTELMQDLSEIIQYEQAKLPLYIRTSDLSVYPDMGAPCLQEQEEDLQIQKDMVSFLYQHYSERITLDEIAASGHVSRSKCCRIFKHYLQQSPIDFLNAYRLRVSCHLLDTTDKSVTEIALACGFHHLSYFSRSFCNCFGCTPREYRSFSRPLSYTASPAAPSFRS